MKLAQPLFAADLPAYALALPEAAQARLAQARRSWREAWTPEQARLMAAMYELARDLGELSWRVQGGDVVLEALGGDPQAQAQLTLNQLLETLRPWKKGPFALLGTPIDAEWRSDQKWERLLPHLDLAGKRVADIGSHNGYFMFRAAEHAPERVVGLEPVFRPQAQWALLQSLARVPTLESEPLGIADMPEVYPKFFDVVLCLGILYHHTDPVGLLRGMARSMVRGGVLLVDCQGIPGDDSTVLVPAGRYAGASGIWWLPTLGAVQTWMRRAGFRDVEVVYSQPLSTDEQRSTPWADIPSLAQFLHPDDPSRTIEGYPAPWRHYVKARL